MLVIKILLFNDYYPRIKLQNERHIVDLLDSFHESLNICEYANQMKILIISTENLKYNLVNDVWLCSSLKSDGTNDTLEFISPNDLLSLRLDTGLLRLDSIVKCGTRLVEDITYMMLKTMKDVSNYNTLSSIIEAFEVDKLGLFSKAFYSAKYLIQNNKEYGFLYFTRSKTNKNNYIYNDSLSQSLFKYFRDEIHFERADNSPWTEYSNFLKEINEVISKTLNRLDILSQKMLDEMDKQNPVLKG